MKYIKRSPVGIEIFDDDTIEQCIGLKKFLNQECMRNGSTYEGRIQSLKYLHKTKGLVPLFVNEKTIFLFTKNIRVQDTILINLSRILSITEKSKNSSSFVFDDLTELEVDVSYNRLKRQIDIAKTIYMNFR